jgi:hypothetical protein
MESEWVKPRLLTRQERSRVRSFFFASGSSLQKEQGHDNYQPPGPVSLHADAALRLTELFSQEDDLGQVLLGTRDEATGFQLS